LRISIVSIHLQLTIPVSIVNINGIPDEKLSIMHDDKQIFNALGLIGTIKIYHLPAPVKT
jgi:hypothetical protein